MSLSVQGGCSYIGENIWEYRYADVDGFHAVQFISVVAPKIGDSIVDGFLVPLEEPLINQDHSRWYKDTPDTWPSKKF